ncbi:MAG: RNA polymerase sigma factor [Planctomycetota bacterium]|jgi:RNA polymerase sigma factor (sigma-70 family)
MTRPPSELSAEDLSWLTVLARALTRDWSEADDLVQETWIAARTSPSKDGVVSRAWLSRVLHRFHLRSLRTARRRKRRETESSRPEGLPPTSDLVERAELQRKLAESMVGLEEPYRTTLMLVVFEAQTAANIAEHQGISVVHARRRGRGDLQPRVRRRRDGPPHLRARPKASDSPLRSPSRSSRARSCARR